MACWVLDKHLSDPYAMGRPVASWTVTTARVAEAGEVGPCAHLVAPTQG